MKSILFFILLASASAEAQVVGQYEMVAVKIQIAIDGKGAFANREFLISVNTSTGEASACEINHSPELLGCVTAGSIEKAGPAGRFKIIFPINESFFPVTRIGPTLIADNAFQMHIYDTTNTNTYRITFSSQGQRPNELLAGKDRMRTKEPDYNF